MAFERCTWMIFIFGSINVDLTVPVPYLPQPGETVRGGDYALLPGGKGANQALAARRAGSEVMLVGAVGEDRSPGLPSIPFAAKVSTPIWYGKWSILPAVRQ